MKNVDFGNSSATFSQRAVAVSTTSVPDARWLAGCNRIGLTAGASTPHWIIEEVAEIYDGNIRNLSREQVTRLLTELTSQNALKGIHEEVQQGVQGDATKQVNLAAYKYKLGDILPDGSIVFHVDASGKHGLAAQSTDERSPDAWYHWDEAKLLSEAHGQDWHLPTQDELALLFEQRKIVGGFASVNYWSSTEFDWSSEFAKKFAWSQYFYNGSQNLKYKLDKLRVRAIRAF